MDIGLYREDEQFAFSSPYLESYSSDSTSFETIEQNELFEEIRPMPQPPSDIFEWHDNMEQESNCDMETSPLINDAHDKEILGIPSQTKEDLHKMLGLQQFQAIWQPILNSRNEHLPNGDELIPNDKEMTVGNHHTNNACLQEILELPEIAYSLNSSQISAANIKIEVSYGNEISKYLDSNLIESNRSTRVSESSDILNTSFSSTDVTNFDIAEYIFEENKQSKQSMQVMEPIKVKKEMGIEVMSQKEKTPFVKSEKPKRAIKAAVKKIDLKAQKYIIDQKDIKKSFSDDEDDVDIETVSEEEGAPVLEAGDLTDLLEQFEANEVKNQEQNLNLGGNIQQQNLSLNVKVEVKTEKETLRPKPLNPLDTDEPDNKKRDETVHKVKIKQEKPLKSVKEKNILGIKDESKATLELPKFCQEQLIINDKKVYIESTVKSHETTTSSKTPNNSSNRHIIDSLPQELINRIKESGKRKPITVIQAIPNTRKRSKIQEVNKPFTPNGSDTVHLDHNYCSPGGNINQVKKDSGFVSSEEDDRTIISRQPTVKNADGTLMVSLLKANTIRHLEPLMIQKKKLNLEEYKKRRNGFLTPNSNSQNCSPNNSTCSSPLPEDEHQKMLKHQEKLRKMAEEVLNAAPKSEKKVETAASPLHVPILIPLSPIASTVSSQSAPTTVKAEVTVKSEIPVKAETSVKAKGPVKIELAAKVEVPKNVESPKIPPNLERKVLVSFGVNTDFKIAKDEDPLAPVEKLEQIKPLLESVGDKINENSLIASVIENIPKVIDKKDNSHNSKTTTDKHQYEHGENKQVLHLEKDRVRCQTKDVETQTNISLIEQTKRGRIRRRISSSSSCSSYKSKSSRRSRKCSDSSSSSSSRSSHSSRRSTSSSRSDYSSRLSNSRSRSRSPRYSRRRHNSSAEREHLNAVEERRIIYVGRIATATTKEDLRKKFHKFGPINKISLHFRDIGYNDLENYGFVTFKYKEDAHEAYEHGNDDPSHSYYKISFGGRREFCKAAYSDLDNMRDDAYYQSQSAGDSYDKLLKEALEKVKKRKV